MKVMPSNTSVSLNNLNVNSVEVNSGIFIGATNMSYGWSSHSKANNGFGSFSNTTVTKSLSVIYDNDSIDSPIVDKKKFFVVKPEKKASKTDIQLTDINVNGLKTNAAISIGDVDQEGWSSHNKRNVGGGENNGINTSAYNHVKIIDNDQIDAPIQSSNFSRNFEKSGDDIGE